MDTYRRGTYHTISLRDDYSVHSAEAKEGLEAGDKSAAPCEVQQDNDNSEDSEAMSPDVESVNVVSDDSEDDDMAAAIAASREGRGGWARRASSRAR